MDRATAAAEQLRLAHAAVADLESVRAPRIGDWTGPASTAAHESLHDLDGLLRAARHCASAWLTAARRAAADG